MSDVFQYTFKEPVPKKLILMEQKGEAQEFFTTLTIKGARTFGKYALIEIKQLIDQVPFRMLDLMPNFVKDARKEQKEEKQAKIDKEQLKLQLSGSGLLKDVLQIFGDKILLNQSMTKIDDQILTKDLKDRITYDDEIELLFDFLFYIWPQL